MDPFVVGRWHLSSYGAEHAAKPGGSGRLFWKDPRGISYVLLDTGKPKGAIGSPSTTDGYQAT